MLRLRSTAKRKLLNYHLAYVTPLSSTNSPRLYFRFFRSTRLYFGFFRSKIQPKNFHRFSEAFRPRLDEHSLSHVFFARCNRSCSIGL